MPRHTGLITDSGGTKRGWVFDSVLHSEVTHELDAAGHWKATLPLTSPRVAEAQIGRIWRHYIQDEGLAFAGHIENVQKTPDDKLEISGPTLLIDLLYKNTLLRREYDDQTINAIVDDLLSGTGWTRNGSDAQTVTARFDAESRLKAILMTLEQKSLHARENVTESGGSLDKKLDIGPFGSSSGVIISGGPPDPIIIDDAALAVASRLRVEETTEEVWNWIIPLGSGDGTTQLTLQHSTRSSPYAIQTMAGPDGSTIYYISDSASITAYGQRERAFVAKDIAPLSNTKAALQAAANSLYDLAVAQLGWWKDKQTAYRLQCHGLAASVRPGDKVRLRWKGVAEHWSEKYVYLDIDTELFVLSRQRRFSEDGTEESELVVSDVDRRLQTQDEVIIGKLEDTSRAFRTRVQQSVSNYTMGPVLDSLGPASSEEMTFDAVIDDNVTQLLRCRLRLKPRPIRSTAKGAASGGGQTSTQDTSHTHYISGQTAQAGGGQTSGGSGSHTHSVPGHRHYIGTIGPTGQYDTPVQRVWVVRDQFNVAADIGVGHYSGFSNSITIHTWQSDGGGTSGNIGDHTHTVYDHTHPVSGVTSEGGSAHSHEVSDHTHGQVYGIYEGSTAAGLHLWIDGVDRTSELGGPWDAAATVDITEYLLDGDGVVVQGAHPIKITTTTLGRVEVYLDWTVIVQAIVAN